MRLLTPKALDRNESPERQVMQQEGTGGGQKVPESGGEDDRVPAMARTDAVLLSPPCLLETVNTWTLQTVAASRFLERLYARLRDETQRMRSTRAGQRAAERMERLRLGSQLDRHLGAFVGITEEIVAEETAWRTLLQALSGLCAYYAIAFDRDPTGLRGAQTATNKAFRQALQGYRTAFPEALAESGIEAALQEATHLAADGLCTAVGEGQRGAVRVELETLILEALRGAAVA